MSCIIPNLLEKLNKLIDTNIKGNAASVSLQENGDFSIQWGADLKVKTKEQAYRMAQQKIAALNQHLQEENFNPGKFGPFLTIDSTNSDRIILVRQSPIKLSQFLEWRNKAEEQNIDLNEYLSEREKEDNKWFFAEQSQDTQMLEEQNDNKLPEGNTIAPIGLPAVSPDSIDKIGISNAIKSFVEGKMKQLDLFREDEGNYYPISDNSPIQEAVNDINQSFNEPIIAKFNSDDVYTILEPSDSLVNKYEQEAGLNTEEEIPPQETLSTEQEAAFEKLQDMGIISKNPIVHNGESLYKLPQVEGRKDEEAKDILDEAIRTQRLDFIHVRETNDNYFVQLGMKEEISNLHPEQKPTTQNSKAGEITKSAVLRFLDKIGFTNVQSLKTLEYQGNKISAEGYIDFAKGMMAIKEGREDYVLPEESMHILVKLIQNSRPDLYNRLMTEVINYDLYRDVVNDPSYKTPYYQTEEGFPDYTKIKEEAVAKLLSEFLVNKLEGTQESARNIEKAYNFWQSILQWVRDIFGAYKNPFKEAINLMEDENIGEYSDINSDEIFFSAKPEEQVDDENPQNKDLYERIKSLPQTLNIHKEEASYYKDGVKVDDSKRVTALVDAYYKKLFGKRNFDADLEAFYEQSRKDGSYIHEIFEATIKSYIDESTGLVKNTPTELDFPITTALQKKMYRKINGFVRNYLGQYDQGTRFLIEQVIYDTTKDRFGTIDFLAIKPDNTIDIIDWKSMLLENLESAKDFKREGIFIQLGEYKRILHDSYNADKFGKLRAIPIRKSYSKGQTRILQDINIGNSDPSKIGADEKYLRPIISPEESTGSPQKDMVINKLQIIYQKYVDRGLFKNDRTALQEIEEAIYDVRVSNDIDNLTNYFTDIQNKINQTIKAGRIALPAITIEEANALLADISFYENIIEFLGPTALSLQKDPKIDKDQRIKLFKAVNELNLLRTELYNTPEDPGLREQLMEKIADQNGVFGLLKPEKVVNLISRYFRSLGTNAMTTTRLLYALTKKAYNKATFATNNDLKSLTNLKFDFETWRKKSGLSEKAAIAKIVDFEKGNIYSKVDKAFYDERQRVFETKDKKEILAFIKANYDTTDYNKWYNETLEEKKKEWAQGNFSEDAAENRRIIKGRTLNFEKTYNIYTNPVTAFGSNNPKVWSRNILVDKWQSEAYKEISKPGNEALLNLYNFIVDKNTQLAETGAIQDFEAHTFFPNIRKTLADGLAFSELGALSKVKDLAIRQYINWSRSLTVSDYQYNYQGARDETGKKIERRFVPYLNRLNPSDKSFDIFTVYGLMTKELNKEKYLQENDEISRTLLHIEKNKQSLLQNKYGTLSEGNNGEIQLSQERGRNFKILEEHVRNIVNGEKLQTDADFVVRFKLKEKWNKSPLGKMYQFDTTAKEFNPAGVSATKFIMWMSSANQKRILGVNLSSVLANLFGGTFSSWKIYSKYLTPEDIKRGWLKMTAGSFTHSEEMRKNAALVDYFLPLLENRENFHSSQLSVNHAARILSQEWLMGPMRKSSEVVQLNIFFGLLDNTGLVDGKIVNLRDKAAVDTGYYDRFTVEGTKELRGTKEREGIEKAFNDKLKEYKEKYNLVKQSKFTTIKEAGKNKTIIEIPGVDRGGEDALKLRDIVQNMSKDSLGESDEYDIAPYKYSIFWRLMMTFKNWIPRTGDVRFGEFRYAQSHEAYEYGRARMMWRAVSANYLQTVAKLIPIPYLTGKATGALFTKDAIIKKALGVYAEKKLEARKLGTYDEKTFISESDFIEKFVKGTDAAFAEFRTLIFMSGILMLGLAAPDPDDSSETKAFKNLMARQIDKLRDEVGFFYSPKSGIDIAGGGPPIVSMIKDSYNLISDVGNQFFGFTLDQIGYDEKGEAMMEKAKPAKRFFKMFPFTNQVISYLPAVDHETAKEWGLQISPQRGLY